jgi:hypothetical protein
MARQFFGPLVILAPISFDDLFLDGPAFLQRRRQQAAEPLLVVGVRVKAG